MLYHLKRSAHVGGNTHFKEMQKSFQGNHLTCLNMCCLKGLARQCQYQTQSHKLIHYVCFGIVFWHILRHEPKTKLPNPCPKPLSFPQWYLHFSEFFTRCSNETTDPNKFADPKKGEVVAFASPSNKQETKQSRNQKTKKQRHTKKTKETKTTRRVGNWACSRCDFMILWILWNVVFTSPLWY